MITALAASVLLYLVKIAIYSVILVGGRTTPEIAFQRTLCCYPISANLQDALAYCNRETRRRTHGLAIYSVFLFTKGQMLHMQHRKQ